MTVPPDLSARVDALADLLTAQGDLAPNSRWRTALAKVPRHLFAPAIGQADPDRTGAERYPIDRDTDPGTWWAAVYDDASIITQYDDGAGRVADGRGIPTSSLSAPGVVITFLELLDVHAGHRVLDVGTGTGWTAGLLSWRVGADQVTTIEIDPGLAAQAARNLKAAGFSPRLVIGDGLAGYAEAAPYDRVHCTCAIAAVPYAWVEQTRPGGRIVAPYQPGFGWGHKLVLDVLGDGTASGRFPSGAGYMMARAHRRPRLPADEWVQHGGPVEVSRTRLDPRAVAYGPPAADLAISAHVPGVQCRAFSDPAGSGEVTVWLLDNRGPGGSWASVDYEPGAGEYTVEQAGERRLWDETQAAYLWWLRTGRPARDRFGLTVTPTGEHFWLDTPENVIKR